MSSRADIAKAMLLKAGSPAEYDSEGLETPVEAKFLNNLAAMGTGYLTGGAGAKIGQLLAGQAAPRLAALGEAGAIFPKKQAALNPENFTLGKLSKADLYTDAEKQYKLWENTAKQYLMNDDFAGALRAKWGMLKNTGGN